MSPLTLTNDATLAASTCPYYNVILWYLWYWQLRCQKSHLLFVRAVRNVPLPLQQWTWPEVQGPVFLMPFTLFLFCSSDVYWAFGCPVGNGRTVFRLAELKWRKFTFKVKHASSKRTKPVLTLSVTLEKQEVDAEEVRETKKELLWPTLLNVWNELTYLLKVLVRVPCLWEIYFIPTVYRIQ